MTSAALVALAVGLPIVAAPPAAVPSPEPRPPTLEAEPPALGLVVVRRQHDPLEASPVACGLTGANKPIGTFLLHFRLGIARDAPMFARRDLGINGRDYTPITADRVEGDNWLTVYRYNPRGGHSWEGTSWYAALYDRHGRELAGVALNAFTLYKGTEIQDVRYRAGVLYFNEACASDDARREGRCSHLTALDPFAERILWRSPHGVSSDVILLWDEQTLVTGHGDDDGGALFRLDLESGAVFGRLPVDGPVRYLERRGERLHAFTDATWYELSLR